jgi:colicin import membrane protein
MSAVLYFEEREDPGRGASWILAAAMHAVLLVVLLFGVRWQSRPPEEVAIQLWEPPPPAVEAPKPAPEPPQVRPAPQKPEPVVEKPDIVEKKAPPPKPKPEPKKAEVKPVPKPEPLKPKVDDVRRMQQQLAQEQNALAIERERQQIKDQLARDAAASSARALADWAAKVRAKVRGNIVLPPAINGNPESIFDVVQLPTGEVLSVKLRKSGGNAALDDAIERAILKSSPLPRPDRNETAPRAFELKYRPLDTL